MTGAYQLKCSPIPDDGVDCSGKAELIGTLTVRFDMPIRASASGRQIGDGEYQNYIVITPRGTQ